MSTTPYEMTEVERDHAAEIDLHREQARRRLADLVKALGPLRVAADRLTSEALYDVEVVETAAARVIPAALDQIEVALAALDAALPHPGQ